MAKNYKHNMLYNAGWKKLTGKIPFSMSNDYLFRALLQSDETTLKNLIASFMRVTVDKINEVEITNPIILGDNVMDKELHLDVRTVVNNEREFDFEMQMLHHEGWTERSLMYLCRAFDNLNHGDSYADARAVWQISFCDFDLFKNAPEFFSTFSLINEKNINQKYTEKFRISHINLRAIENATDEDKCLNIDNWAKIFIAKTWEDLNMLAERDASFDIAISSAWQLTEDEKIRQAMWRREENEKLWNSMQKKLEDNRAELERNEALIERSRAELEESRAELEESRVELEKKDALIAELKAKLEENGLS